MPTDRSTAAPTSTAAGIAGSTRAAPLLEVSDLTVTFPQPGGEDKVVLDRVDLSVEEGEFVTIVGASGSGT